jgi:hypothetical protein
VDRDLALDHQKELVFCLVVVPHKLALYLGDLALLAVQLADDPGRPLLVQERELLR